MFTITVEHSRFGNLQPTATIAHDYPGSARHIKAALYEAAAKLERATAKSADDWCVVVDRDCVYLELIRATDDEAARGAKLLDDVLCI